MAEYCDYVVFISGHQVSDENGGTNPDRRRFCMDIFMVPEQTVSGHVRFTI